MTGVWMDGGMQVVFTEDKLGLTLKSQGDSDSGDHATRTIVKSANGVAQLSNQIHVRTYMGTSVCGFGFLSGCVCLPLYTQEGDVLLSVNDVTVVNLHFADVLCVLKVSSRPIRLRFRTKFPRRRLSSSIHLYTAANDVNNTASSPSPASETRVTVSLDTFLLPEEPPSDDDGSGNGDANNDEDNDDADSHHAVHSESFGDADSTRTTENSSVVTDITELEYKASRHSSRFTAFLRKPFRRADGFEHGRIELRLGIIPAPPRLEIAPESPSKVLYRAGWCQEVAQPGMTWLTCRMCVYRRQYACSGEATRRRWRTTCSTRGTAP